MDAPQARAVRRGLAISLADPGGPIEAVKETAAALQDGREAARGDGRGELVGALAREVVADAGQHKNPLAGFKPPRARRPAWRSSTSSARSTASSPRRRRRRTPRPCASGCIAAAQEPPNAAKEGGFLGFHAERVSEGEQQMLDRLGEVLSPRRGLTSRASRPRLGIDRERLGRAEDVAGVVGRLDAVEPVEVGAVVGRGQSSSSGSGKLG